MLQRSEVSAVGLMVLWTSILTTLIIAPLAAYDPINLPKLLILSMGGFGCFAFLLTHARELARVPYRQVTLLVVAFIVDLILVLFVSGNNFAKSFYGAHGRATGFLAYFILAVLFLTSVISASSRNLIRATYFLVTTGFFSTIYGIIQSIGADPVKWVNRQSPVIGFVGNPNFQSSLVGFSAVMVFALVLKARIHLIVRGALIAYEVAALFVIMETEAQQGFLILIGGTFIVLLIYLPHSNAAKLTKPLLALSVGGLGFGIAGVLNKGPLAAVLYQDSVIFRGDYWRAGWNMTIGHPIFGIGLDNYGDWYPRSRTLAATLRRGADTTSDSAHNVLLDLSSNGGFPLLIIYIVLLLFVIRSARRVLLRSESFDCYFAGILAAWVAYQAQSIISINQLGLAVWGWVLSGLIIGWDIQSSGNAGSKRLELRSRKESFRNRVFSSNLTPTAILTFGVGLILGFVVAMPPLAASIEYKNARESGSVQKLIDSAYKKPLDGTRMGEVALILSENQFEIESISLISDAAREFPDHYGIWAVMAELQGVSEKMVAEAIAQQKRLDPLSPDL